MRILLMALGVMLLTSGGLRAQLAVEIVMDQEQFLSDESLPLAVRITNRSGQMLHLGQKDWLTFSVENRDGLLVSKRGEPPVEGAFDLESSAVATRRVDLMPHFDLSRAGRYQVAVTLHVEQWGSELMSAPKRFDIGRGTKLWEQEFGVPTTDALPEVRKYALLQANYLTRPILYLRLTDEKENTVFRVFPLGPVVSFSRPEHEIDKQSNLHVLVQSGARSFTYSVVNPEGKLIARQTHYYLKSRPTLRGEEGKFTVGGGIRQVNADDIPAPSAATTPNDAKAATP